MSATLFKMHDQKMHEMMERRIDELEKESLPKDWDGVYRATSKWIKTLYIGSQDIKHQTNILKMRLCGMILMLQAILDVGNVIEGWTICKHKNIANWSIHLYYRISGFQVYRVSRGCFGFLPRRSSVRNPYTGRKLIIFRIFRISGFQDFKISELQD